MSWLKFFLLVCLTAISFFFLSLNITAFAFAPKYHEYQGDAIEATVESNKINFNFVFNDCVIEITKTQNICETELPYIWYGYEFSGDSTITDTISSTTDGCDTIRTIVLNVAEAIIPEFNLPELLCLNSEPPLLPTLSDNDVSGTWSPDVIDTSEPGIITITFTPDKNECAMEIIFETEIIDNIVPVLEPIGPICQYTEPPALPDTDVNGIPGTWSPDTIDTSNPGDFEFTFAPDGIGGCAETASITIQIDTVIIPNFAPIGPLCQNDTPPALPEANFNGTTGTWIPDVIRTDLVGIFDYVFIPDTGYNCVYTDTLQVEVEPWIKPEFDPVDTLCVGETPPALPDSSNNGLSGTWSLYGIPIDTIRTDEAGLFLYHFILDEKYYCIETRYLTVTIIENTPPVAEQEIICPTDIESECFEVPFSSFSEFLDAGGEYYSQWEADSLLLISESVSEEVCPKTITREYQIVNKNGDLSNSCNHQITIDDQEDPRINCPPDITVDGIENISQRLALDEFISEGGSISDNCGIDSMSFGIMSEFMDTVLSPNVLKRTYYVADDCLNYDICMHQITIEDATSFNSVGFSNKIDINVFPNPNSGKFNLDINWYQNQKVSVEIINSAGQVIQKENLNVINGTSIHQFDLGNDAHGIYYVKLNDELNEVVKKIAVD